jgi:hypothetical protein
VCAENVEVESRSNAVHEMEEGVLFCPRALRDQLCEGGVPNRCKGRRLRAEVLSVAVKRREYPRQVSTTKMSESEPSDDASKLLK